MPYMVMQVLPALEQGGVEVGTIEIARALQRAGIPSCVVSAGGSMVTQLSKLGVEHVCLPMDTKNPLIMFMNAIRLIKIIKKYHIKLVHVRSRAPAWSVALACWLTHVPFITTYHGIYGIRPRIRKLYNRIMLKGKYVIVGSDFVRQHLIQEYHVSEEKMRLIYRGADFSRFNLDRFSAEDIMTFAEKYQIPTDKPVITLVGRLSPMKGQLLLLQALAKMKHSDVACILVGGKATKQYEKQLKAAMQKLPQTMHVKTLSIPSSEMPMMYLCSDFVVSASLIPETFGRTIVEANAMERCVVAFKHGGPVETLVDGVTGFLIPVGDTDALARTLDNMLDLPQNKREKMQKEALKYAQSHFSVEQMCKKTLELYQEILK